VTSDEKTYKQTHPWLSFEIDLRRAPVTLWLLLGEAKSKCEHMTQVPLLPETAQEVHRLYLAKGALATTAIEGNTLTEEEVRKHLQGELHLPPSKQYLAREVDNVVAAVNLLNTEILKGENTSPTADRIKAFNREILSGLELEEGVIPGEFRKHSVLVARYRGAPAADCEFLVGQLCEWINGPEFTAPADGPQMGVVYAIVKAVVAHLYLAWIHPFGDGNGRTARLVEFQILVAAGVPTPAAHLLSNHYNETRTEYYRQLDRASKSGGDVIPFLMYAVGGFVEQLRTQLALMHNQHRWLVWRCHVEQQLEEGRSESQWRQIRLVLALTDRPAPVPLNDLKQLTPELAAIYATRTTKTLSRDVRALEEKRLVVKSADGYRARTEAVSAMLPTRPTRRNEADVRSELID
jgi:cell filamentation protein, protein adenylyltransferase